MNAYEIPNLRFSLPAGGAVGRHRFVSVDASGNGVQATASSRIIGVSMNLVTADDYAAGERIVEIADGIVIVEASAAIAPGAAVASTDEGKAVTYASGTTGEICGTAITAATAAGQFVAVKL